MSNIQNDKTNDENPIKERKRGRPRKNSTILQKNKVQKDKKEDYHDDIILCLPISSKDVNEKKINGFELIQTECNEYITTEDSNLTDDENEQSVSKLMDIIIEKDKQIEHLQTQIKSLTDVSESKTNTITKNVKLYPINIPFEITTDSHLIIPEYTNKLCLWDSHEINGIPCFLPDKYYDGNFYVVGWFCSLNCAMAYNLSMDDFKVSERYSLLKWLYNKTQDVIEPAPSCRILDKFGGKLTIEEFRKDMHVCGSEYRMMMPPMIPVSQTLEKRINRNICKNRTAKNTILDAMMSKKFSQ